MGDKPRVVVPILWLWVCACGAAEGIAGTDAAGGDTSLVISGSDGAFTPLSNGATIPTYRGPQGGFHLFLALRTTGLDPGLRSEGSRLCTDPGSWKNPCVSLDVFDLDANRQLDNFVALRQPLIEADEEPGAFDLPPRQITLAITSLDQVDGHRFRITASVDDAGGKRAAAGLTVTCAAVR